MLCVLYLLHHTIEDPRAHITKNPTSIISQLALISIRKVRINPNFFMEMTES